MILATDPCDIKTVAHLGECLSEIVRAMEPASPTAELLTLGLSGLQNIEKLERPTALNAVASAVAASSQHLCGTNEQSLAALETAAAAIRELLVPCEKESSPQRPLDSFRADLSSADAAHASEIGSSADSLVPDWDRELLPEFLVESRDHIATAEAAILFLEVNPDDSESINTVLRAFHTIKGSSGLMKLTRIQTLAHQAEYLLIQARDGKTRMDRRNTDLALQSCDAIKFMMDQLDTLPPGEGPAAPKNMEKLLKALSEYNELKIPGRGNVQSKSSMVVSDSHADATCTDTSSNKTEGPGFLSVDEASTKHDAFELTEAAPNSQPSPIIPPVGDASIHVNTGRLDELLNLVGELVIAHSIVAQDADFIEGDHNRLARSVAHAGKIVRQLQDLATSLRMVPFRGTFQKMSRIVRDLSHSSGKTVHFHTSGEDTEIDRNMVQVLNDPLMHMIRNAVDHGIEPAADRVKCGKSTTGELHLRAYHAAGNVVIELEDDGKGLDRDKIIRQAVQQGLVEDGREMSDDEVYSLIFHPGLSTADKVTDVSGRGVGMDVVHRNIESLRGHIAVASRPGTGAKFTLTVPLTTAILDAMRLRVGGQQYLLPTIAIQRSFRPQPGSVSTVAGRAEMVMLRGQLYPLFRLNKLFNIDGAIHDPEQAIVLVIAEAGKRCALMVDEILGQQQVVIKSLGNALADVQGIAGGAILGDGNVGIILDAVGLLQLVHDRMPGIQPATAFKSLSRNPTIIASIGS